MAFSANAAGDGAGQRSEINVTPLIDVLLVLLIIFMVIVPVNPRGLESEVPRNAPSAGRELPPVDVRVMEAKDGRGEVYAINGRVVEREQVGAALAAALSMRANRSVWVEASPELSYRVVAQVVGEAKSAGAMAIALGRAR